MKFKLSYLIILFLIVFNGCKKDDVSPTDQNTPLYLEKIAGLWEFEDLYGKSYLRIEKDQTISSFYIIDGPIKRVSSVKGVITENEISIFGAGTYTLEGDFLTIYFDNDVLELKRSNDKISVNEWINFKPIQKMENFLEQDGIEVRNRLDYSIFNNNLVVFHDHLIGFYNLETFNVDKVISINSELNLDQAIYVDSTGIYGFSKKTYEIIKLDLATGNVIYKSSPTNTSTIDGITRINNKIYFNNGSIIKSWDMTTNVISDVPHNSEFIHGMETINNQLYVISFYGIFRLNLLTGNYDEQIYPAGLEGSSPKGLAYENGNIWYSSFNNITEKFEIVKVKLN